MPRVDLEFKQRVQRLVHQIPEGKVMTYGQIAALCGAAWAAWEVGQIAHFGPSDLPWHRVVNKKGGLARGYVPGGENQQRQLLELENVTFNGDGNVNIEDLLWTPKNK